MNIINKIVLLNGIYDILCGLSILKIIKISYLDTLHLSMIKIKTDEISKRFLGYWILTYGIMRLFVYNKIIISLSYLIEALVIFNEYYIYNTIIKEKGLFVIILSLILSIICIY